MKTQKYFGCGKLLITGEYGVVKGVKGLAVPTKLGQHLEVSENNNHKDKLIWESFDYKNNLWFKAELEASTNLKIISSSDSDKAQVILQILEFTKELKTDLFFGGQSIKTYLEFPNDWGLGSSSTLIYCISEWLEVNPFLLQEKIFGGSGYDIAVAKAKKSIVYERSQVKNPFFEPVDIKSPFLNQLFFIHQNKKQNSRDSLKKIDWSKFTPEVISELSLLTDKILNSENLKEFHDYISEHEKIIGKLILQKPLKAKLFKDYKGLVKSLGAWGGDFFMVSGDNFEEVKDYFFSKEHNTILSWKEMVKE